MLAYLKRLFAYSAWAHRRVWTNCILSLSDELFTQPIAYSIGSIHQQLVHTMAAEVVWISRLEGENPRAMLAPEAYPTRDALRAHWDGVEARWQRYLDAMTEADIDRICDYTTLSGRPDRQRIGDILLHVVNHGTDHRAQTLAMLYTLGAASIDQDYLLYLREHPVQA